MSFLRLAERIAYALAVIFWLIAAAAAVLLLARR